MAIRGKREEFDPLNVSPNRINQYLSCGQAFHMNYIERLPEEASGSAALFGSVLHKALESWAINRQQPLMPLVKSAWLSETQGTTVHSFIGAYQQISVEVIRAEYECGQLFLEKNGRETKAVRMTGFWKKHPVKYKLDSFMAAWLPKLNDSPWRFKENDPLTGLYNESLVLSKRYEARYHDLPNAWLAEFGFSLEWHGFKLNGYVDSIEPVTWKGKPAIGVVDYKTYRAVPSPQKDWRQRVFYDVAVREMLADGRLTLPDVSSDLPIVVGMDYTRWTEAWLEESKKKYGYKCGARVWTHVTDEDRTQLLTEIQMYSRGVKAGVFLPAEKGRNPEYCGYPSNCCMLTKGEGCGKFVDVA